MNRYDYSFKALWTICNIGIVWENDIWHSKILNDCYDYILKFEQEFSRFKNDSDLTILNTKKSWDMSDRFMILLSKSREIFDMCEWYFNPLVNLKTIWYSNPFEQKNFVLIDEKENLSFGDIKNYWNHIVISPDMNIDFWSIAKWFLSDLIWEKLKKKWYQNFLVNMWWDMFISWLNHLWKKWVIWISSPFNVDENIYAVELTNQSISTSWIYLRNWKIWDNSYHHIKNPLSNIQQTRLKSVSIIDFFWYKTDALATAVLAMWYEKWYDFCIKNNIKFIFVLDDWEIIDKI